MQFGVEGVDSVPWKKIIGMRNALVHDYLNIEPEIIRQVIKKETYLALFDFSEAGLKAMNELYAKKKT